MDGGRRRVKTWWSRCYFKFRNISAFGIDINLKYVEWPGWYMYFWWGYASVRCEVIRFNLLRTFFSWRNHKYSGNNYNDDTDDDDDNGNGYDVDDDDEDEEGDLRETKDDDDYTFNLNSDGMMTRMRIRMIRWQRWWQWQWKYIKNSLRQDIRSRRLKECVYAADTKEKEDARLRKRLVELLSWNCVTFCFLISKSLPVFYQIFFSVTAADVQISWLFCSLGPR